MVVDIETKMSSTVQNKLIIQHNMVVLDVTLKDNTITGLSLIKSGVQLTPIAPHHLCSHLSVYVRQEQKTCLYSFPLLRTGKLY